MKGEIVKLDYTTFGLYWTGVNVDRIVGLTPDEVETLIRRHWGLLKETQRGIDEDKQKV